MDDDDDWGLHAVVRGYSSAVTAAAAATTDNPSFPIFPPTAPQNSFDFLTDDVSGDRFQGLQDVYRELCGGSPPPPPPAAMAAHDVYQHRQQTVETKSPQRTMMNNSQQENMRFSNPRLGGSSSHNSPAANPQPNRQRRRKNQQTKIVRQMTQEELSADSWAWRKYGQKPIKGSPYPRNYYRCSTSKGCAARKQVERSPNDAETFVVSYSGEHTHPRPTHRSSLSGSTRAKLSSPSPNAASKNISYHNKKGLNVSSSSPAAALLAAAAGNDDVEMEEEEGGDEAEEEEENIFMISNDMVMNHDDEDLFKGFRDCDDLDGSGGGGDFFRSGLRSPAWTPTSAAAFHGGGGG